MLDGVEANFVGGPVSHATLDAPTRHPDRIGINVVVATEQLSETETRQKEVGALIDTTRRAHEDLVARASEEGRRLKDERDTLARQLAELKEHTRETAEESAARIKRLAEQQR